MRDPKVWEDFYCSHRGETESRLNMAGTQNLTMKGERGGAAREEPPRPPRGGLDQGQETGAANMAALRGSGWGRGGGAQPLGDRFSVGAGAGACEVLGGATGTE